MSMLCLLYEHSAFMQGFMTLGPESFIILAFHLPHCDSSFYVLT